MPLSVVGLVLVAAVVHPTWNLIARRAVASDPAAFIWLTSACSAALYVPVVALFVSAAHPRVVDIRVAAAMMFGTGLLHQLYFLLLQRGYRAGAFSVVYPLARGTGPLLTSLAAVAAFGERLSLVQLAGIVVIVCAIFIISTGARDESPLVAPNALRRSVQYGLATGASIAAYTLWDKAAVSELAIAPIVYDFGRTLAQTLIGAPAVFASAQRRAALEHTWRTYRRETAGVAILSPLAYVLVLYALTRAPVSLVAPLRETSIVIGAFMGARLLKEGRLRRRILAAILMLAGIAAIAG